jgi:hypothetical protein
MAQFERMITEVLSDSPKELIFDLTHSQFISAQGYAAIGHCSLVVPVLVRTTTDLASKVMAIYGYERVAIAVEGDPDRKPSCGSSRAPVEAPPSRFTQLITEAAS